MMVDEGGGNPLVLVRDGQLCSSDSEGALNELTVDALSALVRASLEPGRVAQNAEGWAAVPSIPRGLVRAYMELRQFSGIPVVSGVARVPVVRPDFTVRWEPGWDEGTGIWCVAGLERDMRLWDRGHGARLSGTWDALGASQFDILDVFSQFPFVDRRLAVDCLGAALTPLLATAIKGALPGLLIAARKPGSGKTELAKFCSVLGNAGTKYITWRGETEMQKTIASHVLQGDRCIIIDNIKNKIDSPSLESVLTSRSVDFRVMGAHRTSGGVWSNTSWFMTANGAVVSPDIERRCLVVLLDKEQHNAGWDDSWPGKVRLGEAALVTYMCQLIESWGAAGAVRGDGDKRFDLNFSEWAQVVSGILDWAGYEGFLEAQEDVSDQAVFEDEEDDLMLLEAIYAVMGDEEWTAGQLYTRVTDLDGYFDDETRIVKAWMDQVVKSRDKRPGVRIGAALGALVGMSCVSCGVRLDSRIGHQKTRRYCFAPIHAKSVEV